VKGLGVDGSTGNISGIARLLFTRYLLAFEVTSALLITAAVGAMVLAHVEREPGSRRTQKELSKARFLTDRPQTLPGPGVYARANSVAAPGLLPDGRFAESSFATGIEPHEPVQLPRPTGRGQLGTPDDALGVLDPAPLEGGDHR
jgi:NADH-quinone oxidoreductase subunit J